VDVLRPGEIFGECPLLLGVASNVTYQAFSDASIVEIDRQVVERLIQEDDNIAVPLYRYFARSLFTRLHKFKFCNQPNVLTKERSMYAPLLDIKKLNLPRCLISSHSPTFIKTRSEIIKQKENSQKDGDSKSTSVSPKKGASEISTPTIIADNASSVDGEIISNPLTLSNYWVSVSKRPSDQNDRRLMMNQRRPNS